MRHCSRVVFIAAPCGAEVCAGFSLGVSLGVSFAVFEQLWRNYALFYNSRRFKLHHQRRNQSFTTLQRFTSKASRIRPQPAICAMAMRSSNQKAANTAVQTGSRIIITAAWLGDAKPWA